MLKIIICSDKHSVESDECLTDFSQHIVLGFRAATGLDQIDPIKGMSGKYPLRMYFMSHDNAMSEYNLYDNRDLIAYPLKLKREDVLQIVKRAIEIHWQYSAKYYFATKNCATETLNLLRAAIQTNALFEFNVSTPNELRNKLLLKNLTSPTDKEDDRFYFKSFLI